MSSAAGRLRCVAAAGLLPFAAAVPSFAQSAASHPMITMQDVFDCYAQARAVRTLAESARDTLDVAAAAGKEPPSAEQRREVLGILRAGVRSQETTLQLADAFDACVTGLIKPSATWPSARAAMFRIEVDTAIARVDRFAERYAQVAPALTEATRPEGGAAAAPGPLQTYGGFADALKLKLTATRAKMQALGTRPPAAGR